MAKQNWSKHAEELSGAVEAILSIPEVMQTGPGQGYIGKVCQVLVSVRGADKNRAGAQAVWEALRSVDGMSDIYCFRGPLVDRIHMNAQIHRNYKLTKNGEITTV